MPYISQHRRDALEPFTSTGMGLVPVAKDAGELNYLFTQAAREYIQANGLSYKIINDIIGALEGAKMEFYRRVAAPYEDQKIVENGDVY